MFDLITYERVLMDFGPGDLPARRRHYRQYVEAAEHPEKCPFENAVEGLVLGSEAFIDCAHNMLSRRGKDPAIPELRRLRSQPTLKK